MGIACHLTAHGAQAKALLGRITRIAQAAIVEDQRFRSRAFQKQFAIIGTGHGMAQNRQRGIAVQMFLEYGKRLASYGMGPS